METVKRVWNFCIMKQKDIPGLKTSMPAVFADTVSSKYNRIYDGIKKE